MRAPKTFDEYIRVRDSGRMIDTLGRPLELFDCDRCGCRHFAVEPCMRDVKCPDCGSTAQRCKRGSGHDAAEYHKARMDAFYQLCDELEEQGIAQVARWLPKPPEAEPTALFEIQWASA